MDKKVNGEVRNDTRMLTNTVSLTGIITEEFRENHNIFGERFMDSTLKVARLSNIVDNIPILVSERLLTGENKDLVGKKVEVQGQYRSFNRHTDNGSNRLILNVFVTSLKVLDEEDDEDSRNEDVNTVKLVGYICKQPNLRKTPFGRVISDVLVAVNRSYGKSDYIPTILWGRNACWIAERNIGDKIELVGRIQCRQYHKRKDDGTERELRTAYEVSVSKVSLLEEAKRKPAEESKSEADETEKQTEPEEQIEQVADTEEVEQTQQEQTQQEQTQQVDKPEQEE